MTKQKMNNLFVKGRRAAVIALLAAMPFVQAKSYDERAYMTPDEQTEYETNGVLPSDIENKENKKEKGPGALLALCIFAGTMWMIIGRMPKERFKKR